MLVGCHGWWLQWLVVMSCGCDFVLFCFCLFYYYFLCVQCMVVARVEWWLWPLVEVAMVFVFIMLFILFYCVES